LAAAPAGDENGMAVAAAAISIRATARR